MLGPPDLEDEKEGVGGGGLADRLLRDRLAEVQDKLDTPDPTSQKHETP